LSTDNNNPVRKIIHIDMDAFFASVEQRDNPELKGKPVAVGGSAKRGVVAAASYEAREFGVYSAMPSVTALRKCPQLIFVPPRFDVYKSVSQQIHQIFKKHTDLIEPLSLDEAYLDVTQNKQEVASATEIAQLIKDEIKQQTGLTASAGVSMNKFLAKVASDVDKPDGLFVIRPQQAQVFIDQLQIERFFGVGRVTAKKMKALGIFNGATLKQWSREDLIQKFGKSGAYFYQVAHGQDERPVQSHRIRKSLGAERTFSDDLTDFPDMDAQIKLIADEVAGRLFRAIKLGRTITLKIKYADFNQITRSQSLIDPVNDAETIYKVASQLLQTEFIEGCRIRLLGITLSNLTASSNETHQLSLGI
jgi:DNA polymerase IV